ncbi:hypothetical protein FHETE_5680 [Fusarium heterosporum]|uniref:C2H2-type domain-containing protein n=1 Tax=Fusarium heterosporum TaxID=42747 RepID=A0A8H5WLT3_FUSHE|nr:hypothetical protein FHETE_5680 [Fusarium heterosporum]
MNSSINPGNVSQRDRETHLPQHTTRYDSFSDSVDSEESLARNAPKTSRSQSPVKHHIGSLAIIGQQSLPAVLNKSPIHTTTYSENSFGEEGGDDDVPVQSDLTPRGNPNMLSKPVEVSQTPSVGAAQIAIPNDETSTARRRGRPKGSSSKLKGLPATAASSRDARQVKPRPHLNGFPKRRGRPPKPPSPPPETIYYKVEASFVPFLCEWRDCKAELHNLDTLRRHIYIVHGDSDQCLWGKCGNRDAISEFEDDERFKRHVEEAHLVPFSWHVGDGPNNSKDWDVLNKGPTEEEVPDYLKDKHGNQVTPWIRDQQEEDHLTWKKNRRKLKELRDRMNDNLPDEVDEEKGVEQQGT